MSAKKSNFSIEFKLNCINEAKQSSKNEVANLFFMGGVLLERAHYSAILAERERTVWPFGRAY